jgi:hypothetical protein
MGTGITKNYQTKKIIADMPAVIEREGEGGRAGGREGGRERERERERESK